MRDILTVLGKELGLFRGNPILWVASAIICCIPAIYASTFVAGWWDPYGKLEVLPVALVNADEGTEFLGKSYNVGQDLIARLQESATFGYVELPDEDAARRAVRAGDVHFALVAPADLSRKAVPGHDVATLKLLLTSGSNFVAGIMADRFISEVVDRTNVGIGIDRWRVVLDIGDNAHGATAKLRDGAGEALEGARQLDQGMQRLASGADELINGQHALASGLAGIDTVRLVGEGQKLHDGTAKLAEAVTKPGLFNLGGILAPSEVKPLAPGARAYQDKIVELATGIDRAAAGARELADRSEELSSGLARAAEASRSLEVGLDTLHGSLSTFAAAMPDREFGAAEMAESIVSEREDLAPLGTIGVGYAPYFMALSMWLGGIVTCFLFRIVVYPKSVQACNLPSKVLGKGATPIFMAVVASQILGLTMHRVFGIDFVKPLAVYTVLGFAAATYMVLILALVRLFLDAGKLIAIILLVVQLTASGGTYPSELSPPFFATIGPYLPLTHALTGLRAAMFGSFDGDWMQSVMYLAPWILVGTSISLIARGRFKYVDDERYGPALDLSGR